MSKVTGDMTIGEVVRMHPDAARVLMSFGMGCISCPGAQMETVEQGAMVHGIDPEEMIEALNNLFNE
ncbi:hydrid cluster protein-associated redox disulfide domain protein [Clostridiales bacterium oral taxon 876 str. F0540]|nr:hydrid cluster protein-associated redox disulfide domain protein [Clostridiales bacterium oral taxon 876 str. F0540]